MQQEVLDTKAFFLSNPAPFIIASRISSYPTEEIRQELQELLSKDLVNQTCSKASFPGQWDGLKTKLGLLASDADKFDKLASDYIDIFDRGSHENSLYETEYGLRRSQLKTTELADIAGFYQAFGFNVTESSELLDHLAVECEFYALLLAKQIYFSENNQQEGADIVLDARKKFLQDHLGRYPMAIAKRPGVLAHEYYKSILTWISDVVSKECDFLGVSVLPVDYFTSTEQDEEISCGTNNDFVTQIGKKNLN